ncbi:LAFE_0E07360g1_1 [Lachancea fermentati]|uniref:LAFE_0E07360g1_1 n=1 Tax=Lachancea fermentati TaxID=4955 RepID=A0A1G4MD42_LACFM|nr:LAFE_0E07360g1_1 [Lachancea fermentati]
MNSINDVASAFEILSERQTNSPEGLTKRNTTTVEVLDSRLEENDTPPKNFWEKVLRFVEVKQHHASATRRSESIVESFLYNDDLAPVEAKRRVWTWKQFVFFWISGSFNVNSWQISATGLQLGLNWWQTWICIWIGYIAVALFVVVGSRVGNFYHISFPISSRISFGIYFSLWIVLNRVVMACVWYSVQTYIGSQTVQLMLMSIFGTDLDTRIHNTMNTPNITTFGFMCFMLFWGAQLPVLWFPPHTLRYLFALKSIISPFAAFGFLIWTLKKSHGNLALGSLTEVHPSGAILGWNFIRSIMSALDNFSTLILNAPDFSRFSTTKRSSIYSQLFILPLMYAIISIIGILVTSAAYTMYGVNYWSPLDVLAQFLNHYTSGNRAGVFLISFAFGIAQLGTNIASNSISAGTDMTALLPKFINIRRGSYICAAISLAICPWNLMASSSKFTTALAAYAVFLSSIAGVVAADYYVVRKGLIRLQHCYTNHRSTLYMYGSRYGTNWRAVVAYVVGIVPNFPGFIGSVGPTVPIGAMRVYYLNYFVGYLVSFLVYSALCYYWPVAGMPEGVGYFDFSRWFERWIEVEDFAEQRRRFELMGYEDADFEDDSSASMVIVGNKEKV